MELTQLTEEQLLESLIGFRRDLHRHPEVSWRERRTSQKIGQALDQLGITWRRIAETGVVAELPGRREGPWVALRADIDALPIEEENEVEYASQNPGVMHACGHDGHAAILLGAAHLLLAGKPELPVRLIFQPAEEQGTGARALIELGILDGVAAIFGGHIDSNYHAGKMVVADGAVNASTDGFRVRIRTRGGHAARPHEGGDAVIVGSYLVSALQTLISRELNPAQPAVLTVGTFQAGTVANVLAARAELKGTIRTLHPEVREQLAQGLRRMVDAAAALFDAEVSVHLSSGTPVLVNQGRPLEMARRAAIEVVGEQNLRPLATTNLGGEDFACYLESVPGCFLRWGGRPEGGPIRPAHSGRFDFDERVLLVGAKSLHACVRQASQQ